MVPLFIDRSYRARLGVSFYDRVEELRLLDEGLEAHRLLIVYGPRNVGKSELIRYWSEKRSGRRVVGLEADLLRAGRAVKALEARLAAPGERVREILLSVLREQAPHQLRLLGLVYTVYEALREARKGVVLFIDELHLLPGYHSRHPGGGGDEVLADLEALAHWLAKSPEDWLRVVVTVSEGFVATGEAITRLHGYSTGYLLVDHMDREHFSALYEEYSSRKKCQVSYRVIHGVVGGAPGYLASLCRGRRTVIEFIEQSKTVLEEALSRLRNTLAGLEPWRSQARGPEPRELLGLAYEVLETGAVSPLEQPILYTVGQQLVLHNIAYPSYSRGLVVFRPQIPLYTLIIRKALEENQDSVIRIEAEKILEEFEKEQP